MDIQGLLAALDDETVRSKIRTIVAENNLSEESTLEAEEEPSIDNSELAVIKDSLSKAENENQELAKFIEKLKSLLCIEKDAKEKAEVEVGQLHSQVNEKEQLVAQLQADSKLIADTKTELERENKTLNHKLAYYRGNFDDDIQALELYNRLSEQTRSSLSGIFKDTTVQGLIACGIQEKNISNLWDYAKSETVNGSNSDIDNVVDLFNLLFKRFTLAYPMFARQEVRAGDTFDTQCHIKHSSSANTSGSIERILLAGYVNTKTGKVIKPSVVAL